MDEAFSTGLFVAFIILTIANWILYHKIFDVLYFDFGRGILKEIVYSAFAAILELAVLGFILRAIGNLIGGIFRIVLIIVLILTVILLLFYIIKKIYNNRENIASLFKKSKVSVNKDNSEGNIQLGISQIKEKPEIKKIFSIAIPVGIVFVCLILIILLPTNKTDDSERKGKSAGEYINTNKTVRNEDAGQDSLQIETDEEANDELNSENGSEINYSLAYDYVFELVNMEEEYGSYCLWDLNGDGICELILGHGRFTAEYVNDIWTIGNDGTPLWLYSIDAEREFYVAPDYNGIYAVYAHMENKSISRITVVEGRLKEEVLNEDEISTDKDYCSLLIESMDISDRSLLERGSSVKENKDFYSNQSSEFIFPESNEIYLTEEDLEGLSQKDCQIARNEIYARYGRRFKDEELQAHFDSCSWYKGTISAEEFDESILNEYEISNRDLIVKYEKEQGYR